MKRVLGYVRVSTNKQDLERQKVLIRNYCKRNDFDLIGFEEDFAISGASNENEREGLDRVLKVDNQIADMVVVSELSRLSRQDDILKTLTQIQHIIKKVDLVLLDDESQIYKAGEIFGTDLPKFLSLAVKAYGAADERKKISGRMQSGIDTKFANCVMMGLTSIPYGFKLIDNPDYVKGSTARKLMVVDEEAAKTVKAMYQYVLDGLSLNQITERVNSLNLGGKRFEVSNVRFILHNPVYKGLRKFRKKFYEMPVKIIDDNTWDLVQERLLTNRGYSYEAQKKHFNPLKGIAKCPCGANMTITFGHNIKSGYSMLLTCADRARRLKTNCKNSGMKAEYFFNIVWYDVYHTIKNHGDKQYKAMSNESIKRLQTELLQYKYSLPLKDKAIKDMEDTVANAAINSLEFKKGSVAFDAAIKKVDELQGKLDKLIKERNKLQRLIAKTEERIKEEERVFTEKEMANITEEGKAGIYNRLLERVTYHSFKGHHKGYIEIVYKNGYTSRYLYLNNNQCCRFWEVPYHNTKIDLENMTITGLMIKPDPSHKYKFEFNTLTIAEYQKEFEHLMITYK